MPGTANPAPPETLGAEVRRLRERAGRTIRDVTGQLGWSCSKLSRIETGQSTVNERDLARLLYLYGADQSDLSRIGALVQPLQTRSKRVSQVMSTSVEKYIAIEERAADISSYCAILVPGLLQTPEYAAAVIKVNPLSTGHGEKVRIESRLARQAVLARQPWPRLNIVIDEAVLRRKIGDASIMRRQMLRLIEVSERPGTSIRVLPLLSGAHPAQVGHFTILDFAEDEPPRVFCDGLTGGVLRSRPEDVHLHRLCFQAAIAVACDEQQSVRMFAEAAEDWASSLNEQGWSRRVSGL